MSSTATNFKGFIICDHINPKHPDRIDCTFEKNTKSYAGYTFSGYIPVYESMDQCLKDMSGCYKGSNIASVISPEVIVNEYGKVLTKQFEVTSILSFDNHGGYTRSKDCSDLIFTNIGEREPNLILCSDKPKVQLLSFE